jgi:hypothetical protein
MLNMLDVCQMHNAVGGSTAASWATGILSLQRRCELLLIVAVVLTLMLFGQPLMLCKSVLVPRLRVPFLRQPDSLLRDGATRSAAGQAAQQ